MAKVFALSVLFVFFLFGHIYCDESEVISISPKVSSSTPRLLVSSRFQTTSKTNIHSTEGEQKTTRNPLTTKSQTDLSKPPKPTTTPKPTPTPTTKPTTTPKPKPTPTTKPTTTPRPTQSPSTTTLSPTTRTLPPKSTTSSSHTITIPVTRTTTPTPTPTETTTVSVPTSNSTTVSPNITTTQNSTTSTTTSNSTTSATIPTTTSSPSPSGPNAGTIVLIVLGSLLGVSLIAGLIFWYVRRRRQIMLENERQGLIVNNDTITVN